MFFRRYLFSTVLSTKRVGRLESITANDVRILHNFKTNNIRITFSFLRFCAHFVLTNRIRTAAAAVVIIIIVNIDTGQWRVRENGHRVGLSIIAKITSSSVHLENRAIVLINIARI